MSSSSTSSISSSETRSPSKTQDGANPRKRKTNKSGENDDQPKETTTAEVHNNIAQKRRKKAKAKKDLKKKVIPDKFDYDQGEESSGSEDYDQNAHQIDDKQNAILKDKRYAYKADKPTLAHKLRIDRVNPGFWILAVLTPAIFIAVLFAVIPLGNPHSKNIGEYWVVAFITIPVGYAAASYLNIAIFLATMGVQRPFISNWKEVLVVFVLELILANVTWPLAGRYDLNGFVAYSVAYIATFVGIFIVEKAHLKALGADNLDKFKPFFFQYLKVVAIIGSFYIVLVLYIFGFRLLGPVGQSVLPLVVSFAFAFFFRKAILSFTDPFPIETAQLLAGFIINNMEDVFTVLAFPSITDPSVLIALFARSFFGDIANVFFFTDLWMHFRVWIKAWLKRLFTCRYQCCPVEAKIIYKNDPEDRGHSNNHPGYLRRQARFLLWKLLSSVMASLFYLINVPILRFGLNKKFFPYNEFEMTSDQFVNSIYFTIGSVFVSIVTTAVAALFVKITRPQIYTDLTKIFRRLLTEKIYIALVVAIVTTNGALALTIILYHSAIWYAFLDAAQQFPATLIIPVNATMAPI